MKEIIKKLTLVLIDADLKPEEVLVLHETIKLLKGFADQDGLPAETSKYKDSGRFEMEVMLDDAASFNADRILKQVKHERAPITKVKLSHISSRLHLTPITGYKVDYALMGSVGYHHLEISWEKVK